MTFFSGYHAAPPGYLGTKSEAFRADKAAKTPVGPVRVDLGGNRVIIQAAINIPVFDQRQLGSCEANAGVAGLMVTKPGTPMLSRRDLYLKALYRDGSYKPDGALDDRGTNAETIHMVLRDEGVCLESDCEYRDSSEDWQERATLKALQDGWRHRIDATYRVVSMGQRLGADVRASIDAGRPVQNGGPCSDAYQKYMSELHAESVPFDTMLPSIGGHARLLVGYWRQGDGSYWYYERGSFGDQCGLAEMPGHVLITEQCMYEYDEHFSFMTAPRWS